MGENTTIEWCHHTFSPWHGCAKVSPGCDHCYAETFSRRVGFSETGSKFPIWGKDAERRFFGEKHWNEPLKWNRSAEKAGQRRRVFCGSMCDVMEEYSGAGHLVRETIEESRHWLYRLIDQTPWLDWLLLTKRPQSYSKYLPQPWVLGGFPENLWLGTTVESREYLWRAEKIKEMYGATVRFLSVEPLLEGLGTVDLAGIDWIIGGAESGAGARPMQQDWMRSLKDQCVDAGVAFFYKQDAKNGRKIPLPMLDGQQWMQLPEVPTLA